MKFYLQSNHYWYKIMRISFSQLLIAFTLVGSSYAKAGKAQAILDRTVNISVSNSNLNGVLKELERDAQVKFIYSVNVISVDQKVSISAREERLGTVLNKILTPKNIVFEVVNDRIVLHSNMNAAAEPATAEMEKPQITVTGQVASNTGELLAGVSVRIKGATVGTTTDAQGKYSISAPDNATLIFTYVGFLSQEIPVNARRTINVTLEGDSKSLNEVVVTALGVTKAKRGLVYATGEAKGSEFTQARDNNIASALTGKIAGVDATQINAGPGSSSRVVIRGNNSLNNNQQPLYVINGLPVDNTNRGASQNAGGLNIDRGDAISMINPDDIETISVLKGGAAAALYGSQAANGVILITTKSGKAQQGVGVEFNSVANVGTPSVYPNWQTEYGQGQLGVKPLTVADAQASGRLSFGPKIDGSQYMEVDGKMHPYSSVSVKDNINNFYRPSSDFTNSIAFNAGNQQYTARLSFSDLRSNDQQPNSTYKRQTANLSVLARMGKNDFITFKSNLQYNIVKGHNRPTVGYAEYNAAWPVYLIANTVDIRNLAPGVKADGTELAWNPAPEAPNPYFVTNYMGNDDQARRYIASASVQINFLKNLFANVQGQRDFTYNETSNFVPIGKNSDPFGALNTGNNQNQVTNIQATLNYNTTFLKDFSVSAFVGVNQERRSGRTNTVNGTNFVIPNFISITNLKTITTTGGGLTGTSRSGTNSAFASADFDYKKFLYLTFTGRKDWFSTLNPGSNSIFYPSVGSAFILSDVVKMPEKINLIKLRGSWAQVGSATVGAGQVNQTYTISTTNAYNLPTQGVSSQLQNPDLRPLTVTTSEGGFETQFFGSRLGLDLTYYNKVTTNDIIGINISGASGFSGGNVNVGKITNKGIEAVLSATPIRTKNFSWNATFNYAWNKSKIVELAPTVAEISLGTGIQGPRIVNRPGLPYATVMGVVPKYTADGTPIYNSTSHMPESIEQPLGVGNPPHTSGFSNNFRYKNFSLDILLDGKFGAVGYNNLMWYGTRFGLTQATLVGRETGLQLTGVDQTGAPFSYLWNPVDGYYNNIGRNYPGLYVYNTNFIKLRRLVLNYNIPSRVLRFAKIQSASIAFVASNLLTIYKDKALRDLGLDPEFQESTSNAQGTGGVNEPKTRNLGLNLMVKF